LTHPSSILRPGSRHRTAEPVTDPALRELRRVCQQAADVDALIAEAGRVLGERCDAEAHLFLRIDPSSALWLGGTESGHVHAQCTAFAEVAFQRSSWADYGSWARSRQRVRTLDPRTPNDPYVDSVVRAFGFEHEVHVNLASRGLCYGHFHVSRRAEPFAPEVVGVLQAAGPLLVQALREHRSREAIGAVAGGAIGLVRVAPNAELEPMNAAGAEVLRAFRDGPAGRRRSHPFAALAALLARTLQQPDDHTQLPGIMVVDPRHRGRYRISAERLVGDARPAGVLIVEPLRSLDSRELLLQLGLSMREADVALTVLRGLSAATGSRALAITEHTWAHHLKQVYRKLGVGSRAELAALLLGG
jgi:DNA-binding CsgD family transcriptional regulator